MGLFDPFEDFARSVGGAVGAAIEDTQRQAIQAAENIRSVAPAATGFQPVTELPRTPGLDNLGFDDDPSGSVPIPNSSSPRGVQRAIVLTENFLNEELKTFCLNKATFQKINFYNNAGQRFYAELLPFRFLIPDVDASSKSSIFCLLSIKSGFLELDPKPLTLDGWEFAFECSIKSLPTGDYSLERLFALVLQNLFKTFDPWHSTCVAESSQSRMSWSSWLKDGKNRQYEVSVKSFIENWTDKNLSSGYTGLGYKFELGENPTDLQGGLKSFLTTLSPSPRGSSETLFNALVHYETIESSSNGAPSPQMREFLSQKLASQPGTPGFFAIQKANPTDFMLGKLEFVARKLAFELDQYDEFNPTVRLGSKVSPKLYVKNRGGGVEFYEFRKTIKLRVPENRLNTSMGYNPLMTGHLCVITVLSLQHNVPEKTMEVRGQCKILRTLFIPVESGSDRFINGIGLKCSVNYGSQIDLKEKVPKINFHLFDFDAGEEYFSEVDRELQKQFWGHFREFFQEKLSYMFMVPSDTQRVLEDIRPLLQESLLTVINAEEKDWLFKENRSITVDSGTNDEGYITGKITSLRSRSDINISSLVAPVRSTLSTGTPLVTQPHTKPTKPVIKPTEPSPTPSAMSAQGKLSWNLSSSSITMSNQASGLELIGTNISSTTIPFAYIKVKFTAGEEFSDLFVAEPVTTQVASSPPSDSNTSVLFKSSGEILCGDPELEASPSDTGNWWTVIINPRDNAKVFEVSGHHSLNFSLQGRLGAAGDHPIEVLEAVADDKGKIIYKSKDLFVSIKVGTSA